MADNCRDDFDSALLAIDEQRRALPIDALEHVAPTHLHLSLAPRSTASLDPTGAQIDYFRQLGEFLAHRRVPLPVWFLTADVTYESGIEAAGLRSYARVMNVGLREQHMLALCIGLGVTDPTARVIVNTGDAFAYRSLDQLNALAQSGASATIIGDVAGLTEGRNGRSHQTSGHPGAVLAMPGVMMLEPADTIDLYNCLNYSLSLPRGVVYIRVSRCEVPSLGDIARNTSCYSAFTANSPDIYLVASGLPVTYCVAAAQILSRDSIAAAVINIIDQNSLGKTFADLIHSDAPILTVYNGRASVLQGSVCRALLEIRGVSRSSVVQGIGFDRGTSGALPDLLRLYGLDAEGIADLARRLVQTPHLTANTR